MALGRSNSLSINTGATNSLFAQQQQQQNTSTTGSLFGNSTQTAQAQPSGGLFGSATQPSQPQQSSGLFGTSTTQTQPTSGGLFGSGNNTQQNQSTGGGLFGNSTTNTQNQSSGGLFGGNNTNAQQTQGSGGLFGNNPTSTQQTQRPGGLFGGVNANPQQTQASGGLFGTANTNTQQNQPSNSIFGNTTAQQSKPLFGATANTGSLGGTSSNMFSHAPQANNNTTGSLFGGSTMQAPRQAPSLLSATQHNQMNQAAPFGRLSMGQAAAAPTTVGAAKVDYAGLLPTTRFEDCVDSVKTELENVDKMIQQQEAWARQIEAFLPKHEMDLKSLTPDIDFIKGKAEDVEQALASDAQGVEAQRKNADKDAKDALRCQRVVTNLSLPHQYQVGNGAFGSMYGSQQRAPQAAHTGEGDGYDTDLIGNYFVPVAADLQNMINTYANNLSDIENHMRVIESSAVAQAQQLAQRKAGTGSGSSMNGDGTVRELASTLRGFEESILGVASVVGECREGVNQLVLGRLGGTLGSRV